LNWKLGRRRRQKLWQGLSDSCELEPISCTAPPLQIHICGLFFLCCSAFPLSQNTYRNEVSYQTLLEWTGCIPLYPSLCADGCQTDFSPSFEGNRSSYCPDDFSWFLWLHVISLNKLCSTSAFTLWLLCMEPPLGARSHGRRYAVRKRP